MKQLQHLLVLCLAASGCSGGGGSTGGGAVVVSPSPTPTLTPAPSPSASPTPANIIDYSHDLALNSRLGYSTNSFAYTDSFGRLFFGYFGEEWPEDDIESALTFDAANDTIQFNYATISVNYSATDHLSAAPNFRLYQKNGARLIVGSPFAPALKYVVMADGESAEEPYTLGGISGTRRTLRIAILGFVSTVSTHMESVTYFSGQPVLNSEISVGTPWSAGVVQMSVRSGTDQITGGLFVSKSENGAQVQKANLELKGTLNDATNTFSGTLSDSAHGYSGTFRGALYGPNRDELALIYRFSGPADGGVTFTGELLAGRR